MANYEYWVSLRSWMYDRLDPNTGNFTEEFQIGVQNFLEFAGNQPYALECGKFYCPCSRCKNGVFRPAQKISNHLYNYGFLPGYYVWYNHGEEMNIDLGTSGRSSRRRGRKKSGNSSSTTSGYEEEMPRSGGDICVDMVNDAFCETMNPGNIYQDEQGYESNKGRNTETRKFDEMLEAAQNPLYDGCRPGHSRLSAAARFMNIKTGNDMSEFCADQLTEFIAEILPEGNTAVGSYYELEKLMRNIGLPFHTIDVCPENCMIFWKEDEKWDKCKFCGHRRWKDSDGRTKIPFSRMWYLPIADRLKRLYQSEETATAMRWHAEHESAEGEMCHPSDAAEWKSFNQQHTDFASEPRNVYLGLCTDGFNPFGMSKNHSLWPVIVTPYNLPPGIAMKREYLFLTIMNSGPKHPRASLDIFLRPLIDELKELWSTGVEAYDRSTNETFNMRAVLLWTISDFPAYGMLSGWTTHGRLSCPVCMEDTRSFGLRNGRKSCWFDCHRRFLPPGHRLRKDKIHFLDGEDAMNQEPPYSRTGEQVYYKYIRGVGPPKTSDVGGNGHEEKADGYGRDHNWHKESIFWELSYWVDLNIRHKFDLMHIENFFLITSCIL